MPREELPAYNCRDADARLEKLIAEANASIAAQKIIIESLQPKGYNNITVFTNGWSNFGGGFQVMQYRLELTNVVRLRGTLKPGVDTAIAFTLPEGFRPPKSIGVTLKGSAAPYACGAAIEPSGTFTPFMGAAYVAVDVDCTFGTS